MKKTIVEILTLCIVICAIFSFSIAFIYQADTLKKRFHEESTYQINQISQKIKENEELVRSMEESLKQEYLVKARTVSLFLNDVEDGIYDNDLLQRYMDLLSFDEIHFFDKSGTIIAGTNPEYYGYSFDSGEQMNFFAPLLNDTSLELAQDSKPNTAVGKLMQYVALWNEKKDMIIQIGHSPEHLIEALETIEISYILPLMIDDEDTAFIAYETESLNVLASTGNRFVGEQLESFDYEVVSKNIIKVRGNTIHTHVGVIDDISIVITINEKLLYNGVVASATVTTVIVVLIALSLMIIIMMLLNSTIINPIFVLIEDMKKIGKGNLDIELNIDSTPEFQSLSNSINKMIKNLLEYDIHTTRLFQSLTIPIAMFEYTDFNSEVKITGKIAEILDLSEHDAELLMKDKHSFSILLAEMQETKLEGEEDIFIVSIEKDIRYLKIKSYSENSKVWGFIVDMTKDLQNQEQIRRERDTDLQTGVNTRRAFREKMDQLFSSEGKTGAIGLIMLDLDNLKYVNDTFGHEYGDNLILTSANIMKEFPFKNKILARLGGDEFVIVVHGYKTKDEVSNSIAEFQKQVLESYIVVTDGQNVPLSISGGYAFLNETLSDYESLLRAADEAMYAVKRNKKGSIIEYKPE